MAFYEFETVWKLRAPLEHVWYAIVDAERWPEWWHGVQRVETLRLGDDHGIGAYYRLTWRSRLPYTLTFDTEVVRLEPMALIEGLATGELEGTGIWRFEGDDTLTTVRYAWRVRTTRWWMNLLAPLAKPLFRWNHDWVMHGGALGLAKLLGAELIAG
jgi:hypothetical protein